MKRFNKLICLMLALVMMLSLASLGSIMAEKAEMLDTALAENLAKFEEIGR